MNTVGVRRVRFQYRRPGYHTKDDFCKRRYHATTRSNLFFLRCLSETWLCPYKPVRGNDVVSTSIV